MERPNDERPAWIWTAVGCGSLLLVLMCVAPPSVWLLASANEDGGHEPVIVQPPPSMPDAPPAAIDPSVPVDPNAPRHVSAVVEEATGVAGLRAGATCEFDVTREDRHDGTFWCNAAIVCGGRLLYGGRHNGEPSGYFDCTLYGPPDRHVAGEDPNTSGQDGDPAMRLDTLRGTLRIRDDVRGRLGELAVRARVTGVR